MNRKLVKLAESDYAFFFNGNLAKRGTEKEMSTYLRKVGISDFEFSLKLMKDYGHDVADFGFMGMVIFTQKLEEADLGHRPTLEV